MVYDEGFEINLENVKYFAFSEYYSKGQYLDEYESNCAKTLVGWYHNKASD